MLATLAVITATVTGIMVGVEFAVAVFVGPDPAAAARRVLD